MLVQEKSHVLVSEVRALVYFYDLLEEKGGHHLFDN